MKIRPSSWLLLGLALALAVPAPAASPGTRTLVASAPGYPGSTEQAQTTMDGLARTVERESARRPGSLHAVYHETERGGVDALSRHDAAFALVPLAFYLKHGPALRLSPRLQVVTETGSDEVWSLVAGRGRVSSPASLDGWEITGIPGYLPEFVRFVVLGNWGSVPDTVSVTFTGRAVSALRRASGGENVAVVLDRVQTASIASLPFSERLEVVTRSNPVPGALLCIVPERLGAGEAEPVLRALTSLHRSREGREILETLRMKRFAPVNLDAVEAARKAIGALVVESP